MQRRNATKVSLLLAALLPTTVLAQTTVTFGTSFTTTDDLIAAVDAYVDNPSDDTVVALEYGHPIGNWCVSEIEDFSYLFDANRNPDMRFFNEDLTNWCTCSATDMSYMFAGATRFNGDISGFVTSSVTSLAGMFEGASQCK